MTPELKTMLEEKLALLDGQEKELLAAKVDAEVQFKHWEEQKRLTWNDHFQKSRDASLIRAALTLLSET